MIENSKNGVFQSINAKCANCVSNFKHENERHITINITSDPPGKTNEIDITNAIFYIYGLTVADWSKAFETDLSSTSEFVYSQGIPFCCKCTSALKNVYTSHKTLKELSHDESLFVKAFNSKSIIETEIKTENLENEVSSIDEMEEIKEEINSEDGFQSYEFVESTHEESFELDDALEGSSDNLQSKSLLRNILLNTKEENSGSFPVEKNENVSSADVQQKEVGGSQLTRKRKRRRRKFALCQIKRRKVTANISKTKTMSAVQKSNKESAITSANQPNNELKQSPKECSVKKKNSMPKSLSKHPFNIVCCDKSFNAMEKFMEHNHELHGGNYESSHKLVRCGTCEMLIPTHIVLHHNRKSYEEVWNIYFSCKPCDIIFEKASDVIEHYKTHDPNYETLLCDICEAPMKSDFLQIVHKVKQHPEMTEAETPYHCNKCDEKFSEFARFKRHHDKHDAKTCNVCGKVFLRNKSLNKHLMKVHGVQFNFKYVCEICNTGFNQEHYFVRHKARTDCDPQKRRFVCEKCSKTYLNSTDLRRHMQIHEDSECPNKELFRCPQCGKVLKHSHSLRKHIRTQHPVIQKLFYCEKCGKSTKNQTNMRIHMKVHEKESEQGMKPD